VPADGDHVLEWIDSNSDAGQDPKALRCCSPDCFFSSPFVNRFDCSSFAFVYGNRLSSLVILLHLVVSASALLF